jgi:hypothetical protein
VVLAANEVFFASDDPTSEGRLDPERHAAIYLAFPPSPPGTVDSAFLTLPLRAEVDAPVGLVSLSVATISEPWTTSEALRGGAPAAGPSLTRQPLRANEGTLRLDVTELVRAGANRGFVVRVESADEGFLLGNEASGSPAPTLSIYGH